MNSNRIPFFRCMLVPNTYNCSEIPVCFALIHICIASTVHIVLFRRIRLFALAYLVK